VREGERERARGGGEAVRRAISRYRERERESPVGNSPWLPMQATCVPRSFSTGTMCLPLVMVDMALGLKASPLKSTSGSSALKDLSLDAKRAAPADLSLPGSIV